MAATPHPLATATALEILRKGGNAIDAGLAACAVLAVVEPGDTGIGGDCFAIVARDGGRRIFAYNGSGRTPRRASLSWYQSHGISRIEPLSAHAVTIPGAVEAWHRLSTDHGALPFSELLEPAIAYAEAGVPVQARVALDIELYQEKIRSDPALSELFLHSGRVPPPGTLIRNAALANTLRRIAADGASSFYRGDTAKALVAFLQARGGLHTMEDFETHTGEYMDPISAPFAGYEVLECPPNGQGIIALLILRMVERLGPYRSGPLGGDRLHAVMEAARIAFACRDAYLGDPSQCPVPWDSFLEEGWVDAQCQRIHPDRRLDADLQTEIPTHGHTVYLAVVDRDRNAISLINSIFDTFGSGMMEPETGIVLHNRGQSFRLIQHHPNGLSPRKRPLHTIIPAMLMQEGKAVMPFGVMGGHFQPVGHAWVLANMFHYGLDLQQALDMPRLFPLDDQIWIEPTIPIEAQAHLTACGHKLALRREPIGGGQAIWIDHRQGFLTGASDMRKDGAALGY
ncbi:MAG TPA: gamma-glutamyltransferase family protein [Alphaproteobacteria bacterium]|nr:gamma-glutamyltransferase family protein [Alphaproteobacteria bacterium]